MAKFIFSLIPSIVIAITAVSVAQSQSAEDMSALEKNKLDIKASKSRKQALGKDIAEMEQELAALSVETSATARKMQNLEKEISGIKSQLLGLEDEERIKRSAITLRNKQVSTFLGIMMRMSKAPEESVLVMPYGIKEKVQATRALGMITGNMREEIEALSFELKQLDVLHNTIAQKREVLAKSRKTLENQRLELSKRIGKRKALMQSLHGETIEEQKRIASLVEQSKSLESLVGALEKARVTVFNKRFSDVGKPVLKPEKLPARKKNMSIFSDEERSKIRNKSRSFIDAKGRVAFPVMGTVLRGFGHKKGTNDTLRGIEINASPMAQVIAPFDGEVVFVGPFLEYGQMVIIRHSHQYHTLLAGFGAIDVEPGQFLLEGEPIGVMGRKGSSKRLYMELRKDGKAINPRSWIASYNSHLARK